MPSAVKEARVLEARSGLVLGRFGARITQEHLARFKWQGVAMFVENNRAGQASKPDDFLSGASLSCIMDDVVSSRMRVICDVARPIPPSRASYDVFDASVTAPRRKAALCKSAGNSVLLADQEAPSLLLLAKLLLSVRCWA